MADQQIHDDLGRLLGVTNTLTDGNVEVRDALGRQRGTYDPVKDLTFDWHGRAVGTGNLLPTLVGGKLPPAPLPVQPPGATMGPKGHKAIRKKSG